MVSNVLINSFIWKLVQFERAEPIRFESSRDKSNEDDRNNNKKRNLTQNSIYSKYLFNNDLILKSLTNIPTASVWVLHLPARGTAITCTVNCRL